MELDKCLLLQNKFTEELKVSCLAVYINCLHEDVLLRKHKKITFKPMIVLKQEINKGVSTRPFYAKINFFETCFWTPREAMDLCFWTFRKASSVFCLSN